MQWRVKMGSPVLFRCVQERGIKIAFVIDPVCNGIMAESHVGWPVNGAFFKIPCQIQPLAAVPADLLAGNIPATRRDQ